VFVRHNAKKSEKKLEGESFYLIITLVEFHCLSFPLFFLSLLLFSFRSFFLFLSLFLPLSPLGEFGGWWGAKV